jgi:parallel beta-helix repeat protein
MNTNRSIKQHVAALALLSSFILHPSSLLAQGSLTPPGAPAPTMKSLDQVEARTIVNAANTPGDSFNLFIISRPGSYYLTTNLVGVSGKSGITITADNVTLDLNGFVVQGVTNSECGIYIPDMQNNITVRNGMVSGWNAGVTSENDSFNLVLERLNVSNCHMGIGTQSDYDSGGSVVRNCNCNSNLWDGINCQSGGIVSCCTAVNNGGDGIYMCFASVVSGCLVLNNSENGIEVFSYAQDFAGSEVIGNTCIGNNTASSSSCAGIHITANNTRVEDNHVTANGHAGIQVDYYDEYDEGPFTKNIIIKNSVSGNGTNNYIIPSGQIVGPLITTTGTITNLNPWANFSF